MAENEPLRHGWGGDREKRVQALQYKKEEKEERVLHPNKFGEGNGGILTEVDLELLNLFLSQTVN